MQPTGVLVHKTQGVPLFTYREDGSQPIPKVWLSDEEYGKVLQSKVLACTDVVFVNSARRTFYLAWRKNLPMVGWFWMGGNRGGINTPLADGLLGVIEEETGLANFDPNRLVLCAVMEYFWKDRAQEPKDMGCHMCGITFLAEISEKEAKNVKLDPKEYESGSLREFTRDDLVREKAFPNIVDAYDLVFPPLRLPLLGAAKVVSNDQRRTIYELSSDEREFSIQYFDIHDCKDPLGKHAHANKSETFTVLSGGGVVLLAPVDGDGKKIGEVCRAELVAGSVVHIPPFTAHTFYLVPGTKMHCFSSTAFDQKDFIPAPWLVA